MFFSFFIFAFFPTSFSFISIYFICTFYPFREFDELSASGQKVGEYSRELTSIQAANQNNVTDTSCYEEEEEEGEDEEEEKKDVEKTILRDHIPEVSDADRCV